MTIAPDTLVLFMDGGIISNIFTVSGEPVNLNIVVIDYDVNGSEPSEAIRPIPQGDGTATNAWVAMLDPDTERLHPAIAEFVAAYVTE